MALFDFQNYCYTGMSDTDFNRLSTFIYNNYGIKLPLSKKVMLEGRLHKRLKVLNLLSFKAYCDYLFSLEGQRMELVEMVNVITTNKTDFFREAIHFDFLVNQVLPIANKSLSPNRPFKIWSAGCSTGEEPYTLAMVLKDFHEKNPNFNFEIYATDISTNALNSAAMAVYAEEKVLPVPLALKRKYLLKSKDAKKRTMRIVPELRAKVTFSRLNFITGDFSSIQNFDAVFCRNVLIYFDRATQEKVIRKLCAKLEHNGLLFLGHSESISKMDLPLVQVHPTIFRKV
jgi:chemotaxis protein methyltransferase CheR